ncbi:MAG: quinolinate synthase NadA [Desulfovibrio sp.]|jgi:quinolinate synthase|nr:quinolinate synthase NadA [Desulfovibrio sp.]
MTERPLSDSIEAVRRRFGGDLTIVGHHYQAEEVIRHTDLRGDSLELARKCAALDSRWIMFCGVYFMAESAALLARPGCEVHLPEPSAECSMAMMSPAPLLDAVLGKLSATGRKIVPLAYVNSTLAVKAVVGRHGGSVCTSANAVTMLRWALGRGDAVLFLPDKNLGRNTADRLGIPQRECHVLNIREQGGRIDQDVADRAKLLLWPGFCSIHTRFAVRQVERLRAENPGARVVAHPECTPEVVAAADAAGSTSFIIRYADEMPDGGTLVIGTEINLVERLAEQHRHRLHILPLVESACTHMAQTTEERLAEALDALAESADMGKASPFLVRIDDDLTIPARKALECMLAVCS